MTLSFGKALEGAAEDQPQRVGCRFDRPSPGGTIEFGAPCKHRGVIRHVAWMQVDRNIQLLHLLPKRQIPVFIEIVPAGLARP